MELFAILGIALVVAFMISIYGFFIFLIYRMGKLTEAMNSIPGVVRRELDSNAYPPRLEQ